MLLLVAQTIRLTPEVVRKVWPLRDSLHGNDDSDQYAWAILAVLSHKYMLYPAVLLVVSNLEVSQASCPPVPLIKNSPLTPDDADGPGSHRSLSMYTSAAARWTIAQGVTPGSCCNPCVAGVDVVCGDRPAKRSCLIGRIKQGVIPAEASRCGPWSARVQLMRAHLISLHFLRSRSATPVQPKAYPTSPQNQQQNQPFLSRPRHARVRPHHSRPRRPRAPRHAVC